MKSIFIRVDFLKVTLKKFGRIYPTAKFQKLAMISRDFSKNGFHSSKLA